MSADIERFDNKWVSSDHSSYKGVPCHEWIAGINRYGYGKFKYKGKTLIAHRFSYEHRIGTIPTGLTLDHLCRVRHCVNPDHLEPVPAAENILRGESVSAQNARRTHCKRGHELAGSNLRMDPTGRRICRNCDRDNARIYYANNEKYREYQRNWQKARRIATKSAGS